MRWAKPLTWGDNVDYTPWLSYFLSTLQKQKRYLEEKIQKMIKEGSQQSKPQKQPVEDSFPDSALTRNQKLILDLFNKVSELDASEIAERLNMNSDTVKKNLKSLTVSGYIIKYGSTKGAWYKKRQPM